MKKIQEQKRYKTGKKTEKVKETEDEMKGTENIKYRSKNEGKI
ncbi:hypothetical protein [Lachnoclostridium sp. Marseille-P6806]|nr:hypothetical protein [Lachnoclostridium sp. Marseille-P6806]